jgi:hypothetical protein
MQQIYFLNPHLFPLKLDHKRPTPAAPAEERFLDEAPSRISDHRNFFHPCVEQQWVGRSNSKPLGFRGAN